MWGKCNNTSNIFSLFFFMKLVSNFNKKKRIFLHYYNQLTPWLENRFLVIYHEVVMKLDNFNLCGTCTHMLQTNGQFFWMKLDINFKTKKEEIPYPQVGEVSFPIFRVVPPKLNFYVGSLVQLILKK